MAAKVPRVATVRRMLLRIIGIIGKERCVVSLGEGEEASCVSTALAKYDGEIAFEVRYAI